MERVKLADKPGVNNPRTNPSSWTIWRMTPAVVGV
jgi:hypothetical protein